MPIWLADALLARDACKLCDRYHIILVFLGRLIFRLAKLGVDVCMIVLMKIKEATLTLLAAEFNTRLLLESKLIILCLFA